MYAKVPSKSGAKLWYQSDKVQTVVSRAGIVSQIIQNRRVMHTIVDIVVVQVRIFRIVNNNGTLQCNQASGRKSKPQ